MTEQLAVIKDTPKLRNLFSNSVFVPLSSAEKVITNNSLAFDAEFMAKNEAEGNSFFVQLVAQVVILNPKTGKIFVSKRIQGDQRLRGRYSITFGGHVNKGDYEQQDLSVFVNPIDKCATRELREELYLANKKLNLNLIGYVRDITSDTSEHIGAVYYFITGSASIREKDVLQGSWVAYDDFKSRIYGSNLETWSKAVFDFMYEDENMKKILNL